jgi:3-deoxy-D-arabino-heptulosonate 7-phosphate (DAHP) synthase class II
MEDPIRLPARRGRALAAATTPDRVRRLREVAASAARGDSLLLCAEPRDPTRRPATATANLATLAAFTLAYATGLPVPTVLAVPGTVQDPGRARDRAALLGWLTGYRPAHPDGPIGRAGSWLSQLSLTSRFTAAESEFLARMTKAWAFAVACGGEPAAVARALGSDQFLAWPAATSAHPKALRHSTSDGGWYGLLSPGVFGYTDTVEPDSALVGTLANTVVLRLLPSTRADELARLCARLDPARAAGKLVVLVPPMPNRRLAEYLTATGEHRPAWVLGCGSGPRCGPRLRRMWAVLDEGGARLGGIWLGGQGRWLERVVRLATVLSAEFTVSILDRTA